MQPKGSIWACRSALRSARLRGVPLHGDGSAGHEGQKCCLGLNV